MSWRAEVVRAFIRHGRIVDDTVVEELTQHAGAAYEAARGDGMSATDAETATRALIESWCAHTSGPRRIERAPLLQSAPAGRSWFAGLALDLRLALRLFRRPPGFALVSIALIGLAIAATTSIFSVVNGVVLKPLPWTRADGLLRVMEVGANRPPGSTLVTNMTYLAWADHPATIDGLGGWFEDAMELAGPAGVERVRVGHITTSLFPLLGVAPVVGAHFTDADVPAGDDDPRRRSPPTVVMLSYGFWQERFGGAPDVLGKSLTVAGVPRRIIGVMPQGFDFPGREARMWLPLKVPTFITRRKNMVMVNVALFDVLVRLKPGFTVEQAASEAVARVNRPDPELARERLGIFGGDGVGRINLVPMLEWSVQDVKPALWVLLAAVLLLFGAAIGNVANMQLARAAARQQEVAVRAAIGAGRGRLARQLFIEMLPIAAIGGLLGCGLTYSLMRVLPAVLPEDFPRLQDIAIDGRVLLVVTVLTLFVSAITGLLPTRLARRVRLTQALAEDGAAPVGHGLRSSAARLRTIIITGQVAVAALLLVGAALLSQSFLKLINVDRGYRPDNLLTARIEHRGRNLTPASREAFFDDVLGRLRATQGVTHAGFADWLPLTATGGKADRVVDPRTPDKSIDAVVRFVSADYFASLGIRITRGRGFTGGDVRGSEQVMLVNETFASRYLTGDPLNAMLRVPFHPMGDLSTPHFLWRVVGVVADVNNRAAGEPVQPEVFATFDQIDGGPDGANWLAARTTGDPAALAADLRAIVGRAGADAAVEQVMTMETRLMRSLARPRLYAILLGGFATFALLIAVIGLFGGLSYGVAQRTREFGVRSALGATPRDIMALVMKQGTLMTLTGLALGFGAAAVTVRYLGRFLFGIQPLDATTFAAVGAALLAVALVACAVPARRAATIDAITALRR